MVDPIVIGAAAAGIVAILAKGKPAGVTAADVQAVPALKGVARVAAIERAAPVQVGACVKIPMPELVLPPKSAAILAAEAEQMELAKRASARMVEIVNRKYGGKSTPDIFRTDPELVAATQQNTKEFMELQAKYAPARAEWQQGAMAAQAAQQKEYTEAVESYKAKGWKVHTVGSMMRARITYACPPGTLPIEYQAQVDSAVRANVCLLTHDPSMVARHDYGGFPVATAEELKKRGWVEKRVKPPPGPWAQIIGERVYLCPPGKEPPK